ncbi:thiamine pyrophosphate-binding protein, partial [Candidatus Bathyarchaeota archaeon]|nr:thiamine pyrophosphate-binding protein [Candidatus Bathyarchaeota archaeon]
MSGAKAVEESLIKEGTKVIFGIPGGSTLPLYDVLYDSKIRHILAHHEQCAAHMADGYARASGTPGVCLATSGPGATNLVTGVATANIDSSPIIALTGQVTTPIIGKDGFQEADIVGIMTPVTKYCVQL